VLILFQLFSLYGETSDTPPPVNGTGSRFYAASGFLGRRTGLLRTAQLSRLATNHVFTLGNSVKNLLERVTHPRQKSCSLASDLSRFASDGSLAVAGVDSGHLVAWSLAASPVADPSRFYAPVVEPLSLTEAHAEQVHDISLSQGVVASAGRDRRLFVSS